jgi:hypothetical protein
MDVRLAVAWILCGWSPAARAAAYLQVSAEGDVRILLDGQSVGDLTGDDTLPVVVGQAGHHVLTVQTVAGTPLTQRGIDLRDEETLQVHWNGEALTVTKDDEAATSAGGGSGYRGGGGALQAAESIATVAGALAPASGGGGVVQGSTAAISAGTTVIREVQDARSRANARPPSSRSSHEEHDLGALARSDFDPYAAAGRPDFDASLCTVTLLGPAGLTVSVVVDGQPVATLGPGAPRQPVQLVPGMHSVQVLDAISGALLARGHLDAAAGLAFDLTFSATGPPVASLPGVWR